MNPFDSLLIHSLTGLNRAGVEEREVNDDDSSTPRTIRVKKKCDPSIMLKLTPNHWVYYLWTCGLKAPFSDPEPLDLDDEMKEEEDGSTNVSVELNPVYGVYTFIKSTIKTT